MKKILIILALSICTFAKEAMPKKEKNLLLKALEANESLHMNFFDYKGEKLHADSKVVISILKKIKFKKIEKNLSKTLSYLTKLNATAEKEKNYLHYSLANIYLIRIINKFDLGDKYKAYYCPMVRKKWIQNVTKIKKVHNPYHPEMPHCGGIL